MKLVDKTFLASLFGFVRLGVFAAAVFGGDDSAPSLFGVGLGETINRDVVESLSRYTLCTNERYRYSMNIDISSQWKCYMLSPEPRYQSNQFYNHRVIIDNTNRQIIAVLASFKTRDPSVHFLAAPPSALFTNLLETTFSRYGQYETRLSADMWCSGEIYRTIFFTPSGAGITISHHTQFGGEICLYSVSAVNHVMGGLVFPERYPLPSQLWGKLRGRFPVDDKVKTHPVWGLYEKYRSGRRSTIGFLEERFAISAAKLKSSKLPQPVWEHIVLRKGTGRFDMVVMNGKDSIWEMDAYLREHLVLKCRLHLFDSTSTAYAIGMALLTNRLLPGEVLCRTFSLSKEIPDICFVALSLETFFGSYPTVIILRANSVFECQFYGPSDNLAADAAWILDFFKAKSNVDHVDGEDEDIQMRPEKS